MQNNFWVAWVFTSKVTGNNFDFPNYVADEDLCTRIYTQQDDRFKKEIYELDVLEWKMEGGQDFLAVVQWSKQYNQFILHAAQVKDGEISGPVGQITFHHDFLKIFDMAVVGNIFSPCLQKYKQLWESPAAHLISG